MKYLIVSDIHGSYKSAEIIIDKFINNKCDQIIILGDILYHGPRNDLPEYYNPKKVIELLNPYSNKIIAIKGNCDAEVDQMVLNFKIYDNYLLKEGNTNYYLTHGHHLDEINVDNIDMILYGHTHINNKYEKDNVTYINIASITIPKENNPKTYAILNGNEIRVYDIDDNEII